MDLSQALHAELESYARYWSSATGRKPRSLNDLIVGGSNGVPSERLRYSKNGGATTAGTKVVTLRFLNDQTPRRSDVIPTPMIIHQM